jgi:DNA-binding GntR family transcriptional regulator
MRPRSGSGAHGSVEELVWTSSRTDQNPLGIPGGQVLEASPLMQKPGYPLRRQPLKDEVFDVLHQDVLAGRYASGAWLRQDEIARRLGVSMTPVREALDLLVAAGLAERVPYRGVRILQLSSPEILDAYEMRLLLEGIAARAAATGMTPGRLTAMQELLDEEDRLLNLADLPRERQISRALHLAIVEASGNALLTRIYSDVLRAFPDWMLYQHLYRQPELLADSIRDEHQEHRLIVQALAEGNANLAVARTTDHILRRGQELEKYLGIPREALELREMQAAAAMLHDEQPITMR